MSWLRNPHNHQLIMQMRSENLLMNMRTSSELSLRKMIFMLVLNSLQAYPVNNNNDRIINKQ